MSLRQFYQTDSWIGLHSDSRPQCSSQSRSLVTQSEHCHIFFFSLMQFFPRTAPPDGQTELTVCGSEFQSPSRPAISSRTHHVQVQVSILQPFFGKLTFCTKKRAKNMWFLPDESFEKAKRTYFCWSLLIQSTTNSTIEIKTVSQDCGQHLWFICFPLMLNS